MMDAPILYENSEPTTPTSTVPESSSRKYYRKAAHR